MHLKDMGTVEENRRLAAEAIAIRAGALERCDGCDETIIDLGDGNAVDDARKMGDLLVLQDDPLVASFEGDRLAMAAAIRDAVADGKLVCVGCLRNYSDRPVAGDAEGVTVRGRRLSDA